LTHRPRDLLAEYRHQWARAIVAQKIAEGWNKDAAVYFAHEQIKVTERTVWAALNPPPPAPPLTKERLRQILTDNIKVAALAANTRAVELLRRVAAAF
jgi:hypothetical protein